MLTPEENEVLTRVTGDAPMAKLMRQHWTPVCLMEEVAENDGKPLRVEVLGESYVAFRDTKGRRSLMTPNSLPLPGILEFLGIPGIPWNSWHSLE